MSCHAEKGKPEYSRWNHCSSIPDDDQSNQARYRLSEMLGLLKDLGQEKSILAADILISLAKLNKIKSDKFSTIKEQKESMD